MFREQVDRISLGWSREQLARASGVSVVAIYLLERMGAAGSEDDTRIQNALAQGKSSMIGAASVSMQPTENPQNGQHANDTGSGKAMGG